MVNYIYERSGWPAFTWDDSALMPRVADVCHKQGRLMGEARILGLDSRSRANLETITDNVVKSSEIEGKHLDPNQVRSSVARRLGINIGGLVASDQEVDGVVEMTLDATQNYSEPLTIQRLFRWHKALFSTGQSGLKKIRVGAWREDSDGPMQVVSGPIGRESVHFQAPDGSDVPKEMERFLNWFNGIENFFSQPAHPLLRAGITHLWFVTIHPFEDGNGRIARTITDMVLARYEESTERFYSTSSQIRAERNDYYDILERTQKGNLEITDWLDWFLGCLERSIDSAQDTLRDVLREAQFWNEHADKKLNKRQKTMLKKLFEGFEGKLTSSKWAKINNCSQDTAIRDINDLIEKEILKKSEAGGRSTSYQFR